ncbi:MAG: NUDIX domain-containing protein [Candidatus Paceibacterota bacterium]
MPLTNTVKFLQKAALINQGKVLIMKRPENAMSRPGAWDLPGGNAEWPTVDQSIIDIHQAEIAREIEEETGLAIDPTTFSDENLVHFTTYFEAELPRYAFITGWRVKLAGDFNPSSIKISDEHTELAWVDSTELDNYDFGEPVGTFVKIIIQNALKE